MGLPIFNYDNVVAVTVTGKNGARQDSTAHARSSIRRRPSIHRGRDAPNRISEQQGLMRQQRSHREIAGRLNDGSLRSNSLAVPPTVPIVPSNNGMGLALTRNMSASERRVVEEDYRRIYSEVMARNMSRTGEDTARRDGVRANGTDAVTPTISAVDGLGDRVRSPSPIVRVEDDWQMMRGTMRPDASLPSAHSSFTGMAASNSFSSNANARSLDDTQATSLAESSLVPTQEDTDCIDLDGEATPPRYTEDGDLNAQYLRYMRRLEGFQNELRVLQAEHCSLQDTLRQLDHGRINQSTSTIYPHPPSDDDMPTTSTSTRPADSHDAWATLRHPSDRPRSTGFSSSSSLRRVPSLRRTESLLPQSATGSGDRTSRNPSSTQPESSVFSTRASTLSTNLTQIREAVRNASAALTSLDQRVRHPPSSTSLRTQDTPAAGAAASATTADPDLEHMRGILERLSQRQDIPDEWWASAGLSRDIVRQQDGPTAAAPAATAGATAVVARESHL